MELNETTLDQILTRQRQELSHDMKQYLDHGLLETRHHIGILVEGLRSEIQIVAEGVSGLQEQLIALRELVAKNTADIEQMKVDLLAVRMEMEAIRLEQEMMRSELSIIRNDLKAKAGRDELAVLEARVTMLERSGRGRA